MREIKEPTTRKVGIEFDIISVFPYALEEIDDTLETTVFEFPVIDDTLETTAWELPHIPADGELKSVSQPTFRTINA